MRMVLSSVFAAGLLGVATPALADTPDEVMARFQAVARKGDLAAFKAFIHPSKGLKDETTTVKRKQVTEQYMFSAEFLKTARRDKKPRCAPWKGHKTRCDVSLGNSGGHSYFFVESKQGVFLLKARIFDG